MLRLQTVTVNEYETGLLYLDGRFQGTLPPGRYRLLSSPWGKREVTRVDLRRQPVLIQGQEILTADALPVKLTLAGEYRVVDAALAVHTVQDYRSALYLALQILLREEVQARPIDTLLSDRTALSAALLERGRPEAAALGLELVSVGVKDVILPGDVKRMLAQEAEALRTGRAELVAAREELAATRARANTAQLMQAHPVLLRLREIEALAEVADGAGNTVVLAVPPEMTGTALASVRRAE